MVVTVVVTVVLWLYVMLDVTELVGVVVGDVIRHSSNVSSWNRSMAAFSNAADVLHLASSFRYPEGVQLNVPSTSPMVNLEIMSLSLAAVSEHFV